jgi:hypothetical protein
MVDRSKAIVSLPGYVQLKANTAALEKALDRVLVNGFDLEVIGKKLGGFTGVDRPTSSDGYGWFWSMNFKESALLRKDAELKILIPWAQDWAKVDGLQSDRPIAVMARGRIDISEAQEVVDSICAEVNIRAEIVESLMRSRQKVEKEKTRIPLM